MQKDPVHALVIRPSRWASGLIACIGLLLALNGFVFPFIIPMQGAYDLVMGLLFISFPGVMFGGFAFIQGWLRFRTFLSFDRDELCLRIPTVRAGGCFFPLQQGAVRWSDIQRVTATTCLYRIIIPFPVRQYALHTAQGSYVLAPAFCPDVEALVSLIAEHAGAPLEDLGEEERSLLHRSLDR